MTKLRRASLAALFIAVSAVSTVAAHPLGNFTINHYAGLHITANSITIDYVLDMAEISAFREIATFDADGNGQPDAGEAAAYHPGQCEVIRSKLDLRLDGKPVRLALDASAVEFPPGAGDLLTLRLTCAFSAAITIHTNAQVEFTDNAYAERIGWREIVVTGDNISLTGEFATTSLSNRLSAYPDELLNNPLDQRQVAFKIGQPIAQIHNSGAQVSTSQTISISASRSDAFTQLITLDTLNLPTIVFAIGVSLIWGAMHALTPGHGKTVVGAYLVGARGTARHALYLGLTTTITHTLGVFALGVATLFASQFILPERLFPWLNALSGVLVVGIGANLFIRRLRGTGLFAALHHHHHADHPHGHEHGHNHPPEPDHSHDNHSHTHLPPGGDGSPVTWRSLLALGISSGLLPCPSALVVLLAAIALGRIEFGLALVLAFSLGLAGVLTLIGLTFVYAARFFTQLPTQSRLIQLMPAVSALIITLAGLGITVRALMEIGVVRL